MTKHNGLINLNFPEPRAFISEKKTKIIRHFLDGNGTQANLHIEYLKNVQKTFNKCSKNKFQKSSQ